MSSETCAMTPRLVAVACYSNYFFNHFPAVIISVPWVHDFPIGAQTLPPGTRVCWVYEVANGAATTILLLQTKAEHIGWSRSQEGTPESL